MKYTELQNRLDELEMVLDEKTDVKLHSLSGPFAGKEFPEIISADYSNGTLFLIIDPDPIEKRIREARTSAPPPIFMQGISNIMVERKRDELTTLINEKQAAKDKIAGEAVGSNMTQISLARLGGGDPVIGTREVHAQWPSGGNMKVAETGLHKGGFESFDLVLISEQGYQFSPDQVSWSTINGQFFIQFNFGNRITHFPKENYSVPVDSGPPGRRFGGMKMINKTTDPGRPGVVIFNYQVEMLPLQPARAEEMWQLVKTLEDIDHKLNLLDAGREQYEVSKNKAEERSKRLISYMDRVDEMVERQVREKTAALHRRVNELEKELNDYRSAADLLFGNRDE